MHIVGAEHTAEHKFWWPFKRFPGKRFLKIEPFFCRNLRLTPNKSLFDHNAVYMVTHQ